MLMSSNHLTFDATINQSDSYGFVLKTESITNFVGYTISKVFIHKIKN
jgi:hypothetical protein